MSKIRIIQVHLLILVIVLGHSFAFLLHREDWPFLRYPMFSGIRSSYFKGYELAMYFGPCRIVFHSRQVKRAIGKHLGEYAHSLLELPKHSQETKLLELWDQLKRERLPIRQCHNETKVTRVSVTRSFWKLDPHLAKEREADRKDIIIELDRL